MKVDFQSGHARGPDADVMWGLGPASACVDVAGACLIQICEMLSLLYIFLSLISQIRRLDLAEMNTTSVALTSTIQNCTFQMHYSRVPHMLYDNACDLITPTRLCPKQLRTLGFSRYQHATCASIATKSDRRTPQSHLLLRTWLTGRASQCKPPMWKARPAQRPHSPLD